MGVHPATGVGVSRYVAAMENFSFPLASVPATWAPLPHARTRHPLGPLETGCWASFY